ncbi:HD domain-containing protein [Cytobacillus depressus]|uniref:HD domain-containing protein n=1 Tax=Cytobacillus depressus TaxID=1602942 RepID=A0A6L3V9B0_9BACI|nr:HD domain-containing protein [Cytobacillus depressus]KAB2338200.1 HD domain-containing protein [Cytobacillus depressus]
MQTVIQTTEDFVRNLLGEDSTGHDWFHIERVRRNALYICEKEGKGNQFIIEMAALLHDVPDEKLNSSKEEGEKQLFEFLEVLELEQKVRAQIIEIIGSISFKGGKKSVLTSIEAEIVQDADRLDAIGAIGIARTFAYGGKKGQLIYAPNIQVRETMSEEEYRKGKSSSVHHFYEKLLKLKDLLNTDSAKEIANKRHQFMENYLEEFFNEWNGQF